MAGPPKRLDRAPIKREGGPKLLARKPMPFKPGAIRRAPLAFIEPAPNPMQGMSKDGTNEEQAAEQLTRLQQGFRDRAKAERFRLAETLRSDYYFTVVFEHADPDVTFPDLVTGISGRIRSHIVDGRCWPERQDDCHRHRSSCGSCVRLIDH